MSITTLTPSSFSSKDVSGQYFGDSAVISQYAYVPAVRLNTMLDKDGNALIYSYHPGVDDHWVEKYSSSYYDETEMLYHPIVRGTYPQFHTKLCSLKPKLYTPDYTNLYPTATDWTITRTDSALTITAPDATAVVGPNTGGYQTYNFSASAFKDGVIPKRLILVMQGAGGGGGAATSTGGTGGSGQHGGGGGAGGWCVVVVNISDTTNTPVKIQLGVGGAGATAENIGGGNFTSGENGGVSGVSVGQSILTINGGYGGLCSFTTSAFSNGGPGGVGGSIDTSYMNGTGITFLANGTGGNGGGGRNCELMADHMITTQYGRTLASVNKTETASGVSTTIYNTKTSSLAHKIATYNSLFCSTSGGIDYTTTGYAQYGPGGGSLFENGADAVTSKYDSSMNFVGSAGLEGTDGSGGSGGSGTSAGIGAGGRGGHARVDIYY